MDHQAEAFAEVSYSLVIFAIALVAWGVAQLLVLDTLIAQWMAGVLVFLTVMTSVAAIVHYWRYGQHK